MSAPDKEPQPLGSTSGTRGYIRTCVRCGVALYGVGRPGRRAAGAGCLVHPADVRPGPCGGQHPPVNAS